jgi:hypothetical protein
MFFDTTSSLLGTYPIKMTLKTEKVSYMLRYFGHQGTPLGLEGGLKRHSFNRK